MLRFLLTASLVAGLAAATQAATITNGDFESSTFSGSNVKVMDAGNSAISGWTVVQAPGGSTTQIAMYVTEGTTWDDAGAGTHSVALNNANGNGGIQQTVTGLIVNGIYTISFEMSGNPNNPKGNKTLDVSIDGTSGSYAYNTSTQGNTPTNMMYQTQTLTFKAKHLSAVLKFLSTTSGTTGPVIDNVSIAFIGVPLPPALGLLLTGLPGLFGAGWVLRRKQAVSTDSDAPQA